MSIRTLVRMVALSVGLVLASPLAWSLTGLSVPTGAEGLPALAGVGSLLLTAAYLMVQTHGSDLTRWQVRYHLTDADSTEHLEDILRFLADRTGHFVLEANARGLFLELPPAFGRYIEAQLPRALPEVKLSRENDNEQRRAPGSFFLLVGQAGADVLHWATEVRGRYVRLHIQQGPHTTLIAQTDGTRPPGRWVRLPLPRLLRRLWYRLPLWDDLSFGTQVSGLLPRTDAITVYSSRSRLHSLVPPDEYTPGPAPDGGCRLLG